MQLTFLIGAAAVAVGQAQSVLLVLATALPTDVRNYAIASESAFAAEMSSSLAAGNTPGWYASMPADVKSILPLLYPVAAEATTTPVVISTASSASSASATPIGANSTSISAVHSATLSVNGTRTATGSPLPESTGAASHAKAAVGAGLAGVAGFLAMLAL
ncbi:hypothetical protein SLS59_003646 [Nothophoma quercina]|uniref:Uncharacterized protein n=1 Tax=Nothophoma quercina TaxID=749835 RepID=A0ABR3RK02_9PLEO